MARIQLNIQLHDSNGAVGGYTTLFMDAEATGEELMKEIGDVLHVKPKHQQLYLNEKPVCLDVGPLKNTLTTGSKIFVKHANLDVWNLYRKCVDDVLNNRNAPNKIELAKEARELCQKLQEYDFFQSYVACREYYITNHWKVVRYLEGDLLAIKAAAREHFLSLYSRKGGSTEDYHFACQPKERHGTKGDSCGIICDVTTFEDDVARYQVKTHHHGDSSFNKKTADPDMRELFCYKLFELIGVGPEVQFILPSKDLGSENTPYIATKWRTDFMPLSPVDAEESDTNDETLVQLHLIQVILHVEDLHGRNCGQWAETKSAAIVDFCMGTERQASKELFLKNYNSKLAWDDKAKERFENMPRTNFLALAREWLGETWDFVANVDRAHTLFEKNILENQRRTEFRDSGAAGDGEACKALATDDLQKYVDQVKRNAIIFLS